MYLADYHIHSWISSDAQMPMADMAEAAIAAGLQEICFTDHVAPVCWEDLRPIDTFPWEDLLREFNLAKAVIGDRITLRLGIELGEMPRNFEGARTLRANMPEEVDFIIGSLHTMTERYGCVDLSRFLPRTEAEACEGLKVYLDQLREIAEWSEFSVLGHLTLPLRHLNEEQGFHVTFDAFEEEIRSILRTLIEKGVGIELNTNRGNVPLPDAKWLRLYRDLGGEIITLGSDAHTPRYVGCCIRENQRLLRECGFKYFCTFEKLRPVWHEL